MVLVPVLFMYFAHISHSKWQLHDQHNSLNFSGKIYKRHCSQCKYAFCTLYYFYYLNEAIAVRLIAYVFT